MHEILIEELNKQMYSDTGKSLKQKKSAGESFVSFNHFILSYFPYVAILKTCHKQNHFTALVQMYIACVIFSPSGISFL